MSASNILIEQIMTIFILIFIGVICYKTKLIDDDLIGKLSGILITLIQPILIFTSFQREFRMDLLEGLLISLILAFITHIVAIGLSYILIRRKNRRIEYVDGVRRVTYAENEDADVERIMTIYANMGFMGIPLVNGIYGSEGVFYVTACVMVFNLFIWTHGIVMISGTKKMKLKEIFQKVRNPAIISIIIGFIFFMFQIRLPNALNQSINYISNMNTPFAMLIAGATIAKTDIIKMFTRNPRKYYIVFLKLLLIPFTLMLLYVWLPIDETVKMVAIFIATMPSSTTGTILTIKYKRNSILASEILAMTTLLSILTIPFIIMIAELLSKR